MQANLHAPYRPKAAISLERRPPAMPQWKPEDEALFAELCRRAEQQSREAALRAAPAPPPPPPKGAAGAFAPTPPAAAGGGAPGSFPNRAPCGPPPHPRSGNAAHPGGAGLFIALPRRPRADLGAALYSAFLAICPKFKTSGFVGGLVYSLSFFTAASLFC